MLGIHNLNNLKRVPLIVLWSLKNSPVASSHIGNRKFPMDMYRKVQCKDYTITKFYKMKIGRGEDGLISREFKHTLHYEQSPLS